MVFQNFDLKFHRDPSFSIRIELKPVMDLYTINNVQEIPGDNGLSYRMRPNKNILEYTKLIRKCLNSDMDKRPDSDKVLKNFMKIFP